MLNTQYFLYICHNRIEQKEPIEKSTIMKELGSGNFILGKTADTGTELEAKFASQTLIFYSTVQEKGWLKIIIQILLSNIFVITCALNIVTRCIERTKVARIP